ncbi:ribonuclease E inhibitor RraB [Pseudomonas stutzeri]|uniref:Ribonuclease E inhibitor RraB n=1 Tax=Stutzerimonas stutzeri TaxID=316 RepID=A0A2N8S7P8_STUST|nr:ribonuclease E inhibitor RraB [Stutzerimonas stutzeri]MCQ4294961.1 ribonuclease E inhibitor RraB [Stutzerimonas stutzeri]PNF82639.1 ribonuclease E inhibitor RraB [Stutzerimonas stutzeri]
MSSTFHEDVSSTVLRRMKEGGFDFARVHPIEFYAVFPEQDPAEIAAQNFRGETINTQVFPREDGSWNLQVSKVMYATFNGIGDFEQDLEHLVEPLGGVLDGWGVTQELEGLSV